jgi:hypothetical protein
MSRFLELFRGATEDPRNFDGEAYRVRTVPGHERYFVGANAANAPALLISTTGLSGQTPDVRLENLTVHSRTNCVVVSPDGPRHGQFAIVSCNSEDSAIRRYFLDVAQVLVELLGPEPTGEAINDAVLKLVELFQDLQRPPTESALGLFGELLLISLASSVAAAVEAWHPANESTYDFSVRSLRIEVKTTSSQRRAHEFSLAQCSPPAGSLGLVASLRTELVGVGTSIGDLVDRIENSLASNSGLIIKVRRICARALGSAYLPGLLSTFDENMAQASLRFFDMRVIPAIREPLPALVSSVRFISDLSNTPFVSAAQLAALPESSLGIFPRGEQRRRGN